MLARKLGKTVKIGACREIGENIKIEVHNDCW